MPEWFVIVYKKDGQQKAYVTSFKGGELTEAFMTNYCNKEFGKHERYGPFYQENWAVQKALELEESWKGAVYVE